MQNLSKDGSPHITSESINTATHMAGAVFGLFASGLLIAQSALEQKWWHLGSFIAYGVGLVGLFIMSSLPRRKWIGSHQQTPAYLRLHCCLWPDCRHNHTNLPSDVPRDGRLRCNGHSGLSSVFWHSHAVYI